MLAVLLLSLGAMALFFAYLVALGAGLCETDCSSPTVWEVALVATGGLLWLAALVAFLRRQRD